MHPILNEKTVLTYYLDEIAVDHISFLVNQPQLKECIINQVKKMIAADRMNQKLQVATVLWKSLFEAAMSYMDKNKEGYNDFFHYFDSYVEFEELIFASDSFYRDHTLHCLWVYFLGEYLIRNEEFNAFFDELKNQYNAVKVTKEILEKLDLIKYFDEFTLIDQCFTKIACFQDSIRCISSLTHDLGYPIKKFEKINKSIKSVLPYFSIYSYEDFSFEYTNTQKFYIENFINFISSEFIPSFEINDKLDFFVNDVLIIKNNTIASYHEDALNKLTPEQIELIKKELKMSLNFHRSEAELMSLTKDFENYEHGIMSAYLLVKNLHCFQNINYIAGEAFSKSNLNYGAFLSKQCILRSIALHTNQTFRIQSINSENYLTFIDELEEFSRISRASQNREFVDEFCSTQIYMEDGYFCIDFTFDNNALLNLDPEKAFKGRCKRFLTLFNVKKLSKDLKLRLRCISKLNWNQNVYTLLLANKDVDIKINEDSQYIPRYLKSNTFYPREEYQKL